MYRQTLQADALAADLSFLLKPLALDLELRFYYIEVSHRTKQPAAPGDVGDAPRSSWWLLVLPGRKASRLDLRACRRIELAAVMSLLVGADPSMAQGIGRHVSWRCVCGGGCWGSSL